MSKKSSKEPVTNASITIEKQTADFLKSGGAIQQIDKGTSGQINSVSPKQSTVKNG